MEVLVREDHWRRKTVVVMAIITATGERAASVGGALESGDLPDPIGEDGDNESPMYGTPKVSAANQALIDCFLAMDADTDDVVDFVASL